MQYSKYIEQPELLDELRELLANVPTYAENWPSSEITSNTYRLYARRTPANEATQSLIDNIQVIIPISNRREKKAVDFQRLRLSHSEWGTAIEEISKKLD